MGVGGFMLMLMGGRGFVDVVDERGEVDGLVDDEVDVDVDVDVEGEDVEVDVDKDVMIGAGVGVTAAAPGAVGVVSCESCIVLLPLTDCGNGNDDEGMAGAAT